MSLPEIQMLWVRGTLSTLERLSITSFLKNGHPVRLFSYSDIPNLPYGAELEDARNIVPENDVFTNPSSVGYAGLSMFSNFFRYRLLLSRGGFWADCDLICIKPLSLLENMEHVFSSEYLGTNREDKNASPQVHIQSCFLKAPPQSKIIERALAIAEQVNLMTAPWASTGPKAVQAAVIELDAMRFVLKPEMFCPFGWWQVPDFITPTFRVIPEETLAIHFYNEIWRRSFFKKDAAYDPMSLYERLKERYLGAG